MRNRRLLVAVSTTSTVIWAGYFLLLTAYTSAALVLVAAVRMALDAYVIHWPTRLRLLATGAMLTVVSACAYWTWAGAPSVPSTVASLFMAIAFFNFKDKALRYALWIGDVLWLWNGYMVQSPLWMTSASLGLLINGSLLLRDHVRLRGASGPEPQLDS